MRVLYGRPSPCPSPTHSLTLSITHSYVYISTQKRIYKGGSTDLEEDVLGEELGGEVDQGGAQPCWRCVYVLVCGEGEGE